MLLALLKLVGMRITEWYPQERKWPLDRVEEMVSVRDEDGGHWMVANGSRQEDLKWLCSACGYILITDSHTKGSNTPDGFMWLVQMFLFFCWNSLLRVVFVVFYLPAVPLSAEDAKFRRSSPHYVHFESWDSQLSQICCKLQKSFGVHMRWNAHVFQARLSWFLDFTESFLGILVNFKLAVFQKVGNDDFFVLDTSGTGITDFNNVETSGLAAKKSEKRKNKQRNTKPDDSSILDEATKKVPGLFFSF